MLIIDRFAYTNKFCNSSPYIKVIISLSLILLSVVSSNIYFLCFMIAGIILTTIFGAGIPKKSYAKMIAAPIVYLSISIFTVIFTFGFSDNYISVVWHKFVSNDAIEVTTAMIDYDLNVIIEPNKYSYIMEIDKDHFWVIEHLASLRGKASN